MTSRSMPPVVAMPPKKQRAIEQKIFELKKQHALAEANFAARRLDPAKAAEDVSKQLEVEHAAAVQHVKELEESLERLTKYKHDVFLHLKTFVRDEEKRKEEEKQRLLAAQQQFFAQQRQQYQQYLLEQQQKQFLLLQQQQQAAAAAAAAVTTAGAAVPDDAAKGHS